MFAVVTDLKVVQSEMYYKQYGKKMVTEGYCGGGCQGCFFTLLLLQSVGLHMKLEKPFFKMSMMAVIVVL